MNESTNEFVNAWFAKVAPGANEPVYLNIDPDDRAFISNAQGEVVTLESDWDVLLDAPNLAALGELCRLDLTD